MTDKELIKEEIQRRISNLEQIGDRKEIEIHFPEQFKFIEMYEGLLQFIDSLSEESGCEVNCTTKNEDLEEDCSFEKILQEIYIKYDKKISIESLLDIASYFAEWQKQQMKKALQTEYEKGLYDMREEMMKDAVDATIFSELKGSDGSLFKAKSEGFRMNGAKISDRIKVIPIKPEQQ